MYLAPSGERLRSFGDVAAAGRELVAEARALADVVIIDTPPALATNDASELIPASDAVVVVSRVDKTTTDGARRTRFLLDRLSAPVAGVVAVGVAEHPSSYGSYYTTSERGRGRKTRGGRHVRPDASAPTSADADGAQATRPENGGHTPIPLGTAEPTPESESQV